MFDRHNLVSERSSLRKPSAVFSGFVALCLMVAMSSPLQARDDDTGDSRTDSARKPNVVLILADDLGWGEVGVYGQDKIRTPNIDQMAHDGMRFTDFYAGSAVCAPTRSTLIEGKHTGHSTIRGNQELGGWSEELGQVPLRPGTFTIGHLFQRAGYRTAAIGKWGLGGPGSTGLPNDQGFDYFYGYLDQRQAHNYYPTHLWENRNVVMLRNKYFDPHATLNKDDDPNDPESYARFKGPDYSPDLMARKVHAFISENRDRPFFLYFPITIPHVSLQVPDDEIDRYDGAFDETPYTGLKEKTWLTYTPQRRPRAAYAAMVTRMDRYVGDIIHQLEALGLDDNTIVVFASDNGPTFNGGSDSRFFESAGPFSGLKGSLREGGIRVPLIVRWPGHVPSGHVSNLPSATFDFMRTFAELIGQRVPNDTDGVSLLPEFLGKGISRSDALYWELGGSQAVRLGKWKALRLNAKRDPNAPIQLFDLEADPAESRDVAKQHPDVAGTMRQLMRESRNPSILEAWELPSP